MRWIAVAALGVGLLAGCEGSRSTVCDNGAICPEGEVCTGTALLCGDPARVAACNGQDLVDFDPCVLENGAAGACYGGICSDCTVDRAGCSHGGWQAMTSAVGDDLFAIWVGGAGEAYAVGGSPTTPGNSTALAYDGVRWARIAELEELAAGAKLVSIWGTRDPLQLFVLADNGKVFQFAGTWREHSPPSTSLLALWGSGPTNVLGVGFGGEIWRFDGTAWSQLDAQTTTINFTAIAGTGADNVLAIGSGPGPDPADPTRTVTLAYIRRFDGTGWSTVFSTANTRLRAIWATAEDDAVAVGDFASTGLNPTTVVRLTATGWAREPELPVASTHLHAAWSSGPGDVFVGGQVGTILHHDGTAWTAQDTPSQSLLSGLAGWADAGSGRRDVFAVGPGGAIWRYTGP